MQSSKELLLDMIAVLQKIVQALDIELQNERMENAQLREMLRQEFEALKRTVH